MRPSEGRMFLQKLWKADLPLGSKEFLWFPLMQSVSFRFVSGCFLIKSLVKWRLWTGEFRASTVCFKFNIYQIWREYLDIFIIRDSKLTFMYKRMTWLENHNFDVLNYQQHFDQCSPQHLVRKIKFCKMHSWICLTIYCFLS